MSVEKDIQDKKQEPYDKDIIRPKFSVVIPLYNEETNIQPLYTRLTDVMTALGERYEIIFVDDGSTDGSFQNLKRLYEQDRNVKVIRFTRNFGQHPATIAGFHQSNGEIIITLDSDLQNPPEEIPVLLKKMDEGYEVVFGIFKQRKHSALRKAGSIFTKAILSRILPVETTYLSAFRVMRAYIAEQLKQFSEKSKFLDGLICWMGYKVGTVEVEHQERQAGKTKYNLFKLISLFFDMIISLTEIPLKLAIYAGAGLGIIALALGLMYLILYFVSGYSVPGFATTVILITVFAGIQLFCLGILGEYIGRMNKEVKKKPEYIIRDILGEPNKDVSGTSEDRCK